MLHPIYYHHPPNKYIYPICLGDIQPFFHLLFMHNYTICQQNPEHPQIRKHRSCLQVSKYYLLQCHSAAADNSSSINHTPHQVKIFCDSYNCNFLNRNTDSKISAKCIWRIIHCRINPHTASINYNTSHEVIYIQQRHLSLDEGNLSGQKREQATCNNQIGADFHTIKKQHINCSTKRYTSSIHVN